MSQSFCVSLEGGGTWRDMLVNHTHPASARTIILPEYCLLFFPFLANHQPAHCQLSLSLFLNIWPSSLSPTFFIFDLFSHNRFERAGEIGKRCKDDGLGRHALTRRTWPRAMPIFSLLFSNLTRFFIPYFIVTDLFLHTWPRFFKSNLFEAWNEFTKKQNLFSSLWIFCRFFRPKRIASGVFPLKS